MNNTKYIIPQKKKYNIQIKKNNYGFKGIADDIQQTNSNKFVKRDVVDVQQSNSNKFVKRNVMDVQQSNSNKFVKRNVMDVQQSNSNKFVKRNVVDVQQSNRNKFVKRDVVDNLVKENGNKFVKQGVANIQQSNSNKFVKQGVANIQQSNSNKFVKRDVIDDLVKENGNKFVKQGVANVQQSNGNKFVKRNVVDNLVKENGNNILKGDMDGLGKENGNNILKGDMDGLGKEKGNMIPRFVYLYKQQFEMEAVRNKTEMNGLSPLSGYEPTYNPKYWNDNKNIKNNNNCYSYSVNNKNLKFGKPQPGYFARFNHIQNNQYKCAYFFKRILNDIPSVYLTSFKQKCKKGFHKAFFAIDSNKNEHDYHFYRQDKNKLWSHKPGTTNVINYDAQYKIIKNPLNANRNYIHYNYDKPCFFFCVNNKFGKTKAKI